MRDELIKKIKEISLLLGFIPTYTPSPIDQVLVKDHYNYTQLRYRNCTQEILDKAISELRFFLREHPSELAVWSFLGQLYRISNQTSLAKKCFFFQISHDYNDLNPWLDLAYCYRDEGNVERYELIFMNYSRIVAFYIKSKISSLDERQWNTFFELFQKNLPQITALITNADIVNEKKVEIPFLLNLDSHLISVSHISETGIWTQDFLR